MSSRPPTRPDRTPPAPMMAARGVVLVVIAAGIGILLLAKALDGPSSADIATLPGGGGPGGVEQTTTVATTLPATSTTAPPVLDTTMTVIVANASGVGGAAGRLTDRLSGELGALMGDPTNQPDGAPDVDQTTVYYTNDAAIPSAQAIANHLSTPTTAVEVAALPSTDLVEDGDIQGAGVVIILGRDLATTG